MANEPTIDVMNEAIALFDGYERYEDKFGMWFKREGLIKCLHPKLQELKYHTSWSWLMPVWVRFRDLDFRGNAPRRWNHENHKERIVNCLISGTIGECHEAMYNGIKWYQKINQQKQKDGEGYDPASDEYKWLEADNFYTTTELYDIFKQQKEK